MGGIRPGKAKGPWVGSVIDATEVTDGANIGTGTGQVFSARVGHILNFRTLLQGTGITITTGLNEVTISATGGTIANVGTGTGLVWRDTVAGTVNLKTIKQGTLMTVTNNADDITIATTAQNNTASNLGTGTGVYATKSGSDLRFNSIKAGNGISVALVTNDITITNTGIFSVANVGTGTGLVWRDTVANVANLKSIKQGTGITVTNNADDVTITCTVTQGPTGSGTNPKLTYWTAGTTLGSAGPEVNGNHLFFPNSYRIDMGDTNATYALSILGNIVGTHTANINGRGDLSITGYFPNGLTYSRIRMGDGIIAINEDGVDCDVEISGNTTGQVIVKSDAGNYAWLMQKKVVLNGVLDNAGSAYAGGAVASPTTINLTTAGNVIRVAPASALNAYYDLTNATNWQIVNVHNEGLFDAFIFTHTAGGIGFCVIPSTNSKRMASFVFLQYSPYGLNGIAPSWTQCNPVPAPNTTALVDAATVLVNAAFGDCIMNLTLGGNRTLGAPSNPRGDGQRLLFRIRQDGTGSRTLAYDAIYRFSTDLPSPTLSTGASKIDYLGFVYDANDNKWDFVGKVFGF